MKYNIIDIADAHWGAIPASRLNKEFQIIFDFIDRCYMKGLKIHLVNILGDWFNSKINMNSKTARYLMENITRLKEYSKKYGFKIVIIKGTLSHDNDQLDVLDIYSDENFIIVRECKRIEILPQFFALYCPDENIPSDEYYDKYSREILTDNMVNAAYFHGNFDIIMSKLPDQETEIQSVGNVIFNLDFFTRLVEGPLTAGHWHTRSNFKNLMYVGSFSRFGHGEEDDKGFLFTTYDTEDKAFYRKFIKTPLAKEYKTFNAFTHKLPNVSDYSKLISVVKEQLKMDTDANLRIAINITDDKTETLNNIKLIREAFANERRVNVLVKNRIKESEKQLKKEQREKIFSKYSYILKERENEEEIIRKFALDNYDVAIPVDFIKSFGDKVREKLSKKDKTDKEG